MVKLPSLKKGYTSVNRPNKVQLIREYLVCFFRFTEMDSRSRKIPSKTASRMSFSSDARYLLPARVGQTAVQAFSMDLYFLRKIVLS